MVDNPIEKAIRKKVNRLIAKGIKDEQELFTQALKNTTSNSPVIGKLFNALFKWMVKYIIGWDREQLESETKWIIKEELVKNGI